MVRNTHSDGPVACPGSVPVDPVRWMDVPGEAPGAKQELETEGGGAEGDPS